MTSSLVIFIIIKTPDTCLSLSIPDTRSLGKSSSSISWLYYLYYLRKYFIISCNWAKSRRRAKMLFYKLLGSGGELTSPLFYLSTEPGKGQRPHRCSTRLKFSAWSFTFSSFNLATEPSKGRKRHHYFSRFQLSTWACDYPSFYPTTMPSKEQRHHRTFTRFQASAEACASSFIQDHQLDMGLTYSECAIKWPSYLSITVTAVSKARFSCLG